MANQTQQNADCVREFQQVLRDRSSVTSENDKLSQEQRQLIYGWIHNRCPAARTSRSSTERTLRGSDGPSTSRWRRIRKFRAS